MCRVSANNVRNKTTDNAGDDSPLHDDSKKSSTGVFALSEPQRCAGVSREAEAMPSILSSESTLSGHFETDEAHSVGDESNYYEELGSVSRCRCSREVITRYARGVDYSRYHAHKLYHRCPYCGRRPAAFLCLHCLTATCPSHVTQHYNESTQAGRCCGSGKPLCRLFINILDITTSFDRVFWCESCRSFTWRYTEIYDPFVDQLAVTQGTYLQDPVRDIVCVGYEVQLKSPSQMQKLFSPSLHTSSVRDRSLLSLNPSPQGTALFIPPCTAPADPRAVSLVPGCSVNSLTESSKPNERGLSVTCSSQRRSVIQCAQFERDTVHVGVTTPKLVSLGAKVQGWRATQEDAETAFAIEIPALPSAPGRQMGQHVKGSLDEGTVGGGCDARSDTIVMAVFCVFDGHGGDAVAKLAASRFEAHLRKAVNSGKHNDIQARAVLRRLDLESTTPMLSMSDGSPRHIQESTTLSHAQFVEAVANMSSTFRGEEPGTPVEAQMTVEALRRHMEDYAANPHLAGLQATSTGGNSVTSHQGLSQVPSSLVSRHEMELLRLYFASVMEDALLSLDDELWRSAEGMRGDYNCVGCTACIVGITPNFVLCANVGDSGAAFYTPHTIRQISIAHRTTDPIEATRIAAAGYSLVGHRIEGLLAVPRALGDYDFKQCGGRSPQQQAVTAVPDVTIMPVSPQAAAGRWGVVVACDGVWDSATLHQVHHAIMNTPNDLDVATSATDAILRAKDMAPGLKGKKFCKSSGAIDNIVDSGNGGEPKASIDALLLASAAGVFAQCVAPCENEEGIGMDNCSLFIIEQR
ncbi:protein phosphatase 2C, putative [Trypanosoma vivax Y486]|uniref:protein-serine/threonine phosphatase n=1 Tax=Trypanosoma vivax (strain Y486) TaxID=1055687 RepID=F9WQ18_TRYVY|nr:protein phosphatase 2C, putative [Trypanosoma vivax Y486]|eukprot:CCD19646.1 protein phosphatase 2C, putative [Trypanosoma vivax Y486]